MDDARSPVDAVHWVVKGRVQGVGFRWFVQRAAQRIGVRGDVCNLPDGNVEIRAEGTGKELKRLLEAVREGPSLSRVDAVEEFGVDKTLRFRGFDIRY